MKKLLSKFKNLGSRGDTLVEVLISIAIITLVVAIGYTVANRSLQSGTSASQRNQALSFAQGQVEHLVNAVNANGIDTYKIADRAFCINPGDPGATPPSADSETCKNYNNQNYAVSIRYDNDSGIFTVKSTWAQSTGDKSSSGNEGQVSLYYKAPGLYLGKDVCPNIDGIQTTLPSGLKIQNGECLKPDGSKPTAEEIATTSTSRPPNCKITSVVPGPPGKPPAGVNGSCDGGHCGSPSYPGGCDNIQYECNPAPACLCTVSIRDYNYSGTGSDTYTYDKCAGQGDPNEKPPTPASVTTLPGNNCPDPTMVGDYNPATGTNNCQHLGECSTQNQAGIVAGAGVSNCQPIPKIDPSTGNTSTQGCIPADWNNFCTGDPSIPPGGGGNCSNGATNYPNCDNGGSPAPPGTCANGGTDYPTCTPPRTGGGGGGGGYCWYFNDSILARPTFGIMGGLNWLLPKRFAVWC